MTEGGLKYVKCHIYVNGPLSIMKEWFNCYWFCRVIVPSQQKRAAEKGWI